MCRKFPPRRSESTYCSTVHRLSRSGLDRRLLLVAAAFLEARRFAGAITEVVQLGTTHHAAALDFDLGNARRMERKLSLDALVQNDPPHREHLAAARATASDHNARKNLDALFVAFQDLCMHIDRVPNVEIRNL